LKRSRHKPRHNKSKPRIIEAHELIGFADFYCDLPEEVRSQLSGEVLRAVRGRELSDDVLWTVRERAQQLKTKADAGG